ncbi:MAG: hypothetical protein WCJ30_07145 [Deltaproteobacteria bacterium]
MSTITAQIETRINAFVTELRALVNQSAVESVGAAFGAASSKKTATPAAPRAVIAERPSKKGRIRRSPEDIARSVATVLAYLKSHANTGSESLRKDLKLARPVVQDALGRLIDAKKAKMKGVKRGATYTAV